MFRFVTIIALNVTICNYYCHILYEKCDGSSHPKEKNSPETELFNDLFHHVAKIDSVIFKHFRDGFIDSFTANGNGVSECRHNEFGC